MTTGVYKITNLVNGKVYIGASKRIEDRWSEHKSCANSPIHSDLETYGLDNFKFEVLIMCPEDMLCQWERDMICLYDADNPERGYNDKNDRPYSLKNSEVHRGISFSEEHKRKISEAKKGRPRAPLSDETRRKMSEAKKGQKAWNKGIPLSEEQKKKQSEKMKENWQKKKENICS